MIKLWFQELQVNGKKLIYMDEKVDDKAGYWNNKFLKDFPNR